MRWLIGFLTVGIVLVLFAFGFAALIPAERLAQLAAAEFARATGHTLTVAGPVRARVWPLLGAETGPVTVANAAWSAEGPLLAADRLYLGLNLGAVFGGEIRLTGIAAEGLRLVLERPAEGAPNWRPAAPAAGGGLPAELRSAVLRGGEIVYIDHARGRRVVLAGLSAAAALDGAGALRLTAAAEINGQAVALTADAPAGAALLAGQVTEVTVAARAGGLAAGFEGRAGLAPAAAEGALSADLGDLRALAALAGRAMPDLPAGLGARERALAGRLTLAPGGSLHLRGGTLTLDGNRLAVEADLTFGGPRPKLVARAEAGTLTLPGLAPAGGGGAGGGWPGGTIDVAALAALDAEVTLAAEAVAAGPLAFGPARLSLALERARAVFTLRQLALWGGQVAGEFVVNGRGGLSVGGDLAFRGIAVQPALTALAGWDGLAATGDLDLRFLGVGQSVAAIMAGLEGEGRLALGPGRLAGADLPALLHTLDTAAGAGGSTAFETLTAGFTIAGGVLATPDLVLRAPPLTFGGTGRVNLGAQTLDLRLLTAEPVPVAGAGTAAVPLIVTGPWSAPQLRPDLQALADQKLAAERAALEAQARAAAAAAAAARQTAGEGAAPVPGATPQAGPAAAGGDGAAAAPGAAGPAAGDGAPAELPVPPD
jgi:AsmA protein